MFRPEQDFLFALASTEAPLGWNLEAAFRITPDRPSFAVTFNLYLALLDGLVKRWRAPKDVGTLAELPAPNTVAKELPLPFMSRHWEEEQDAEMAASMPRAIAPRQACAAQAPPPNR